MTGREHTGERGRAGGARTAGRALRLLQVIAESDKPMGLAELTRAGELNKNAVYRVMRELEMHSFVAREAGGRRYVVGPALVGVSERVMRRFTLRAAARLTMEKISELTPETISLHLLYFEHRICIDVIDGRLPIRRVVALGETLPLWAGPSGKAMLAHLPEEKSAPILEWAAREGQNLGAIRRQLDEVRTLGYLATLSDRIRGVGAVSVPIFDSIGVVASITVSGPEDRWNHDVIAASTPAIVALCTYLSETLQSVPLFGARTEAGRPLG